MPEGKPRTKCKGQDKKEAAANSTPSMVNLHLLEDWVLMKRLMLGRYTRLLKYIKIAVEQFNHILAICPEKPLSKRDKINLQDLLQRIEDRVEHLNKLAVDYISLCKEKMKKPNEETARFLKENPGYFPESLDSIDLFHSDEENEFSPLNVEMIPTSEGSPLRKKKDEPYIHEMKFDVWGKVAAE